MSLNRKRSFNNDEIPLAAKLDGAPAAKKQRKYEEIPNEEISGNKTALKELNAYLLWFDQFHSSNYLSKEIYTKMKKPLRNIIDKINFDELENVWFDSPHILVLLEERCAALNVRIIKAITKRPQINTVAYRKSTLSHIDDSFVLLLRYSNDEESHALWMNMLTYIYCCEIQELIGNSKTTTETYQNIIGLCHNQDCEEDNWCEGEGDNWCEGWIINPKWKDFVGMSRTKPRSM